MLYLLFKQYDLIFVTFTVPEYDCVEQGHILSPLDERWEWVWLAHDVRFNCLCDPKPVCSWHFRRRQQLILVSLETPVFYFCDIDVSVSLFFCFSLAFPLCLSHVFCVDSVLRSRNRCVHRDFQVFSFISFVSCSLCSLFYTHVFIKNIGVNGARAGSMNATIVHSMSRIQVYVWLVLRPIFMCDNGTWIT